ncbi:MAG: metallophosphoesterase [Pirellulales bacterium]
MPEPNRTIACFGGIYSNYLALEAAVADARARGAQSLYCLGDFGAFGPHPDRAIERLREAEVLCIQGNYDHSIGNGLNDCQCGYTDPRDNYFARISYDYTFANTSSTHRDWMRNLPAERRLEIGPIRLLLCHGSPRRTNEFLWESTTPTHFLDRLADQYQADLIVATHTGIKWHRSLSADRQFVNVGVLGRPENDGTTAVWYALLTPQSDGVRVDFVPVDYDFSRLAREMRTEGLPEEFAHTIESGWWTTCLEILPSKERSRGRY